MLSEQTALILINAVWISLVFFLVIRWMTRR